MIECITSQQQLKQKTFALACEKYASLCIVQCIPCYSTFDYTLSMRKQWCVCDSVLYISANCFMFQCPSKHLHQINCDIEFVERRKWQRKCKWCARISMRLSCTGFKENNRAFSWIPFKTTTQNTRRHQNFLSIVVACLFRYIVMANPKLSCFTPAMFRSVSFPLHSLFLQKLTRHI